MSEFEMAIWAVVGIFVIIKILEATSFNITKNPDDDWKLLEFEKQNSNNAKIYKQVDKIKLIVEELYIKKEELENEIENLEFESSSDFEKENTNSTKIKKLRLKIKHIEISIENKNNDIDDLNRELKWMY